MAIETFAFPGVLFNGGGGIFVDQPDGPLAAWWFVERVNSTDGTYENGCESRTFCMDEEGYWYAL